MVKNHLFLGGKNILLCVLRDFCGLKTHAETRRRGGNRKLRRGGKRQSIAEDETPSANFPLRLSDGAADWAVHHSDSGKAGDAGAGFVDGAGRVCRVGAGVDSLQEERLARIAQKLSIEVTIRGIRLC